MKILALHNKYRQEGGEDQVFHSESELLKSKGHAVEKLEFHNEGRISPFKLLHNSSSVKRFKETVKNFQPDILHVHNLFHQASPAILTAAKELKLAVVMTLHNYRLICANGLLLRKGKICEKCVSQRLMYSGILHNCYRDSRLASLGLTTTLNWHRLKGTWQNHVDRYIALSVFEKNKLLRSTLDLTANQIEIKPNFITDPSLGKNQRESTFLYVGRLAEEKGIRILLAAQQSGGFSLEIIGSGPLEKLVKKAVSKQKGLVYSGKAGHKEVLERMKSVLGVIVPSIWYEPFGMTIIESLACGTPVIASNIGTIPEIITHNENGLLFTPGNPNSLLSQIKNLPLDENWQKFSEAARSSYLKKYTAEHNYQQLMNIYQNVLKIQAV
jgi:glycosyltransferase involved in cell wall biosynthesis